MSKLDFFESCLPEQFDGTDRTICQKKVAKGQKFKAFVRRHNKLHSSKGFTAAAKVSISSDVLF